MSEVGLEGVRIATAPVTYGVYGNPSRNDPATFNPDALLASMSGAGFNATELGPPGYFGSTAELKTLFTGYRLDAAGAYAAIRFSEPEYVASDFQAALHTIEELAVFSDDEPRLILADGGSDLRSAFPVRTSNEDDLALASNGWRQLKATTRELSERAEAVGIKTAFHPHLATYVETPDEVDTLLAETDLPLVFDTGHLLLGGTDTIDALRRWWTRVDHVHLKDVRTDVPAAALRTGRRHFDSWWHQACVPLGNGDARIEESLRVLVNNDYTGWIVIEQDRPPGMVADYHAITEVEKRNLAWLEGKLEELVQ